VISLIRFLVDEDFDNDIIRGVHRRIPKADIVRVQDEGLSGAHDTLVLVWAANHGRVVLTHDVTTMMPYAYTRVAEGLAMPGVFVFSHAVPISAAIESICLIAECSLDHEWEGQVRHLPL
jgi:hypothetical protein